MPRLLIDTERMANLASGLGQVCLHLGRELVRQKPADWELTFLVPKEQVGTFGPLVNYVVATKWRRFWRFRGYDVWHCLFHGTKFLPARSTPFIYTILDLNFLAHTGYSERKRAKKKAFYQRCIDRAAAITTISGYVAEDVRHQMAVPPTIPVQVIYCGVEVPDEASATPPTVRPQEPYLLFVSMVHAHKNVHVALPLLQANPTYRLVFAGRQDESYRQRIQQEAERMGVADRLLMPGAVDESTKWWLYRHCDAFLFPSLMEGFGLPVIEAMACGKPVFCSTLTSLPEVGGPEAFYFSDFSPETVIRTFQKGIETYRDDPAMPDRIRQHSQQFRWDVVAAEYWELYRQVAH